MAAVRDGQGFATELAHNATRLRFPFAVAQTYSGTASATDSPMLGASNRYRARNVQQNSRSRCRWRCRWFLFAVVRDVQQNADDQRSGGRVMGFYSLSCQTYSGTFVARCDLDG